MTDLIFLRNAISSLESLSTVHNRSNSFRYVYSSLLLLNPIGRCRNKTKFIAHLNAHTYITNVFHWHSYSTMFLLDGGLNGTEWPLADLCQLGIKTVVLPIRWVKARTFTFMKVFNFTFTFMKVSTSPKLSLYLAMALFLLRLDLHSVL